MLRVSLFQNTAWIKGKKWTQKKTNKLYLLTWNLYPVSPAQLLWTLLSIIVILWSHSEPIESEVSHDVDDLPDSEMISSSPPELEAAPEKLAIEYPEESSDDDLILVKTTQGGGTSH